MSGVVLAIARDAADALGRWPPCIPTLTVYFIANMRIAVQKTFVTLLLLCMLQSAGVPGAAVCVGLGHILLHLAGKFLSYTVSLPRYPLRPREDLI